MQPVEEQERGRHATSAGGDPTPPKQARAGWVLLTAFVVELVAIGGGVNQVVAKHIANTAASHHGATGYVWLSLLTYRWRFAPVSGDHAHLWPAQLALIGTTIVLSLLLILAVIRGGITWGRAFFGTWMAVIVATLIGGYVYGLIYAPLVSLRQSIAERALFGASAPGALTIFAAAVLGLLTAIVASIVAIATRHAPAAAEGLADDSGESIFTAGQGEWNAPPPAAGWAAASWPAAGWSADQPAPNPNPATNPPQWGQDAQHTSRLPSMSKQDVAYDSSSGPQTKTAPAGEVEHGPDQPTTALPTADEPPAHAAEPPPAAEHTAEPPPTEAIPAATQPAQPMPTEVMPAQEMPPQQQPPPQPQERHGATAFPRPPDDEDLQTPHDQG